MNTNANTNDNTAANKKPANPKTPSKVNEDMFSMEGLPEEIQAQLRHQKDTLEDKLLEIFEVANKTTKPEISLNEIIVALWRTTEKVMKRASLHSLLGTLEKKGLIEHMGERSGQYRLVVKAKEDITKAA